MLYQLSYGTSQTKRQQQRHKFRVHQGDGSRTRSQGVTAPCAEPLTLPPSRIFNAFRRLLQTPPERFELPMPLFAVRYSDPLSHGGIQIPDMVRLPQRHSSTGKRGSGRAERGSRVPSARAPCPR